MNERIHLLRVDGRPIIAQSIMVSKNILNDAPDMESLYIQASYPFTISELDMAVFAGMAQGESPWHGVTSDKFEFINVGFSASKSIKITESYSLPLTMEWILNPHTEKTFLVFKISI